MDDIKRIYSLLVHSDGLKVREISNELALDKFYVAEVLFSPENIPYWYQNDDSLWFAKEGAIQIEEPEKTDELVTPAEKSIKFNINKFLQGDISDSLQIYLNQIPRFRLYTNDELLELLNRYKAGDRNALELLVKSQQRFVANIAFIYRNRGASLEDIIQEGNIGLLRAIERFDDSQYRSFSNYAKAWIMQAISFSMTSMPFTLKLPANLLSLHRKVCRFKDKYEQINGIPPSVESIQIDESIADDRLAMIDGLPDNLRDLTIIYEDLDFFENTTSAFERSEEIEYNQYKANVLLNSLSARSKMILKSYFGIGCAPMSLEQIGIKHKLTRERVRQILFKMIRILRERVKKNDAPLIVDSNGHNVSMFDDSAFTSLGKVTEPNQTRLIDVKNNVMGFIDPVGLQKELESIRENSSNSILANPSKKKEKVLSLERGTFLKEMESQRQKTIEFASKLRVPQQESKIIRETPSDGKVKERKSLVVKREKSVLSKERSNNTPKNTINTNILSQLFLNTVSTYNFYWFISILQLLQKTKNSKLLVYDIVARMVANAWSPLICHNLEFGSSDSLKAITAAIQRYDLMPINTNVDQIFAILERYKKEYRIKRLLRVLTWNVPYRFLHPWIKTSDNKDLMYRSQHWENGCMYSLYMNDSEPYILINPIWMLYLLSHHKELLDFSCKSLSAFLLPKNPKIVNIEEIIAL